MLVEARTIRIQFAKKYKHHFKFLHRLNRRQFFWDMVYHCSRRQQTAFIMLHHQLEFTRTSARPP